MRMALSFLLINIKIVYSKINKIKNITSVTMKNIELLFIIYSP